LCALSLAVCKNDTDPTPQPQPPVISSVSASPASLTLPGATTSVTLSCSATSADGSAVKSTVWSVKDKPAAATVTINGNTASGLTVAGVYKFEALVTGSNDKTATSEVTVKANLNANVTFVSLGVPGTTINFSPSAALPAGVTYKITDNSTPKKEWTNGQIDATEYSAAGNVTFTQTFYLNGTISVGTRTVEIEVNTFPTMRFSTVLSDTGASGITIKHP